MCMYVTVEFSVLYFHVLCLEWVNDPIWSGLNPDIRNVIKKILNLQRNDYGFHLGSELFQFLWLTQW